MTICPQCHAYVPEESMGAHTRWHAGLRDNLQEIEATLALMRAHQENLIERMYNAEKKNEAVTNRVFLLERSGSRLSSGGDPQGHHHQMEG